jgi:hypothetical protein
MLQMQLQDTLTRTHLRAGAAVALNAAGGRVVDKEMVVLDLGGASLGMLKVMSLFKAINSVGSSYFPERTVHILVLNAPRVFSSLWSIVRPARARFRLLVWRRSLSLAGSDVPGCSLPSLS